MRLLSLALQRFGGCTKILFEPAVLVCKIRLALLILRKTTRDSLSRQHLDLPDAAMSTSKAL